MSEYKYKPTTWIGGKTIGTADVMNNIEDGIEKAHERLDNISFDDVIGNIDLSEYAKKTDIPTVPTNISAFTNDKGYLTSVPSEYVTETELNSKGYLTEHQDLSNYATKSELHNHSNKIVLDGITSAKVTEWNNKSTFSGSYNDLTNKPTIPTKISQLTNDSKFITTIPSEYITETELNSKGYLTEHQDISGKADKTELHSHNNKTVLDGITSTKVTEWNNKSNLALGTTSSTAYRGDYGSVAYTHSQSTHAPSNAQKNSDITKAEIEAKLTGAITSHTHSNYSPISHTHSNYSLVTHNHDTSYVAKSELNTLTLGVHTDGLIYLFKNGQPIGNGVTQSTQSGDVVGYVDSENNIVLSGKLADGTYKLKYEMEDGSKIDVGQIELSDKPAYTNQIPLSINSDGTPFNGGQGWKTGYRLSLSSGGESAQAGCECTGFIPVPNTDAVIRMKNVGIYTTDGGTEGHYGIVGYDKNFNKLSSNGMQLTSMISGVSEDGVATLQKLGWATHFANTELAYVRISSSRIDESSIITVNEPIV